MGWQLVLILYLSLWLSPIAFFFIEKRFGVTLWSKIEGKVGANLLQTLLSFQGRINRKKYWLMHLLLLVIFFFGVVGVLGLMFSTEDESLRYMLPIPILIFFIFWWWAGWALQRKRWQDRGKPGWWSFINLIPLIGWLWAFIELGCLRGTEGPNRFGPDPLEDYERPGAS